MKRHWNWQDGEWKPLIAKPKCCECGEIMACGYGLCEECAPVRRFAFRNPSMIDEEDPSFENAVRVVEDQC